MGDKRTEYSDNAERVGIEQVFSWLSSVWIGEDHDKAGYHNQRFDSIIDPGNECRPPCVSFIATIFDIAIFKVQTAWIYTDIYAK